MHTLKPAAQADKVRSKRGRPPLSEIEQRRQHILTTAKAAFVADGFADTSLAAIALAAGVTKRTIYQHFGDKEALFRAVCTHDLLGGLPLRFDIGLDGRTADEALLLLARELIENAFADDVIALERAIMSVRVRFPQLVNEIIEAGMARANRAVSAVFDQMAEAGLVPVTPTARTARTADFFYDAIVGNRNSRMALGHDEPAPDDEELAERVSMFLHGRFGRDRPDGG